MAGKLQDETKVVRLPTRAAKGAGKSKPKPSPASLKPAVPEAKVARAAGDMDDKKLREALQLQLIGLRQRHRKVDSSIEVLRDELRELVSQRKEIRSAIETAGMPLKLFDEAYVDAGTTRVDLERKEALREVVREAYGLPVAPQKALDLPEAAKPAVYWEAEGYKAGINGDDPKLPVGCPPENGPDFMRGYDMATERNAKGLKVLAKKPASDPAPAAEPKPASAAKGKDKAPTEEDGVHRPFFEGASPPGPGLAAPQADGFEASEAELAAQKLRPGSAEEQRQRAAEKEPALH